MIEQVKWDNALINKYNVSGPRYTSYPTALSLSEGYQGNDLINALAQTNNHQLSLYVHIPFCHQLCYYCGCNKIITRHQHKADIYLDYLAKEIQALKKVSEKFTVKQLHLGGGTPTFLTPEQMSRLIDLLENAFAFSPDCERSIEIDPRSLATGMLPHLHQLGFNRVSFGIQDFNDQVQEAVNRPQHVNEVKNCVKEARELGFNSINVDMIYGLPLQTVQSFAHSINQLLALSPDRVSVFNYAHLPSRFAAQRKIKDADLPSAHDKLAMFKNTLAQMTQAGYQFIGMDHFAKKTDELAIAQREGKLHRNFQGYTTGGECELLGLGVSSISQINGHILQNHKELKSYYHTLEQQQLPTHKGVVLTQEDTIRSALIKQLICHFELDIKQFERTFKLDFNQHFASELNSLTTFINDELVTVNPDKITVTAKGILFIRIICMCFDEHLQAQLNQQRFSRVI